MVLKTLPRNCSISFNYKLEIQIGISLMKPLYYLLQRLAYRIYCCNILLLYCIAFRIKDFFSYKVFGNEHLFFFNVL